MTASISEIRQMVELLPDLSDLVQYRSNNIIKYEGYGEIDGICLYNTGNVAVMRAIMEAGSVIFDHTHKEIEIITVVFGELEFSIEGDVKRITKGEVIKILPAQLHHCTALQNTEMICITIPASRGYPGG